MTDKVETMAYVGDVPWHGRGVALPENPTVEQMRAAAGLEWDVELAGLTYLHGGAARSSGARSLIRTDTGAELDTVGGVYTPIKNAEICEFFRGYVEAGELTLETAGVLDGGKYVWALAKMKKGFTVGANDRVEGYVFLANPHQYGKGATAKFTATRVVCWNTWQAALAGPGAATKIWHVGAFDAERRAAVQEEMGIARDRLKSFRAAATRLADLQLSLSEARQLAGRILRPKATMPDDDHWAEAPREVVRVITLYQGEAKGALLPSAKDTAWGLFNAITQYTDWEHGRSVDTRLRSAWMGSGAALKARALDALTAYADERGGK